MKFHKEEQLVVNRLPALDAHHVSIKRQTASRAVPTIELTTNFDRSRACPLDGEPLRQGAVQCRA